MNTKFLLEKGKLGKKIYYSIEVLKYIRSKIIKGYKKLFGINEVSQRKIRHFVNSNELKVKPKKKYRAKKTLTIVIPCYKHGKYIEKTFLSIINQTKKPDKVVFIDDFSPDNALSIFKRNVNKYKNKVSIDFKIICNNKNIGQSASLNKGIKIADTDLIMILNADDYLFHDTVEVVLALLDKYKEVYMLGSGYVEFCNDDFLDKNNKYIQNVRDIESTKLTIQKPMNVLNYKDFNDLNMTHSSCTFYKIAWEYIGGYNSNKRKRLVPFSDRDFQLRLNAFYPVAISYDLPFVFWRTNSSVDIDRNS
ncbi:MAG: glycosyltransferase family 2 protein [Actinobacteria bacterium]|nr:glycosyltransferase family 2 protein [Actinomycetota bacterium]